MSVATIEMRSATIDWTAALESGPKTRAKRRANDRRVAIPAVRVRGRAPSLGICGHSLSSFEPDGPQNLGRAS